MFISEKTYLGINEKLLQKGTYHHDANCFYLSQHGAKAVSLNAADKDDLAVLQKCTPCKTCTPKLSFSKPGLTATIPSVTSKLVPTTPKDIYPSAVEILGQWYLPIKDIPVIPDKKVSEYADSCYTGKVNRVEIVKVHSKITTNITLNGMVEIEPDDYIDIVVK